MIKLKELITEAGGLGRPKIQEPEETEVEETEDRVDERGGAPTHSITSAVELIRWEVLQHYPDLAKWIKPKLRQIENAVASIKRTGGR